MENQELNLDECFDENGVFYYGFGSEKTSVQFLLSLIPDESEADPPTVEIQEVRGFSELQIRELKGEIEDLTETDYYAEWLDFPNLISQINEYLYARTGEDEFRDRERERKKAEKEKARLEREQQKKLEQEKEQRELEHRREMKEKRLQQKKMQEVELVKQKEEALARFQAQLQAMNELQKQRMREQLILAKKRREEQRKQNDEKAWNELKEGKLAAVHAMLYDTGKWRRPAKESTC